MRAAAFILSLALFALPAPAWAWADHHLLTRELLRDQTWLNDHRKIKVTEYTYSERDPGPYHPDYRPPYIDRLVGSTTTAREILIRYVDEPDWGMDEGLELSPLQSLAGGSKGYRHQKYFFFRALRVGEAPKRAAHFYEMARVAFKKKDPYWGFRFLARALHYVEDLGQPYHTNPLLWRQVWTVKGDFKKLVTLCSNMHFHYEAYVSHQLTKEAATGEGKWIAALRDTQPAEVVDAESAAFALADYSQRKSTTLLDACERFWPKKVKSVKEIVPIRVETLEPDEPPPSWGTIQEITDYQLRATAMMVKGLLAKAKDDLLKAPSDEE